MSELLIRPSHTDVNVIADVLASKFGPRPIDRLVVDVPLAISQPRFSELAARSGTPLLVDPMTHYLQGAIDSEHGFARHVPYAHRAGMQPDDLLNPFTLDTLVAETVELQAELGASAIIPPYFHARRPSDPAFAASLLALGRTARRMRADELALPLFAVLCGSRQAFSQRQGWEKAVDQFLSAASESGVSAIGLCLSPLGNGNETKSALVDASEMALRLRGAGIKVYALNQGLYGPGLVAAGVDGYETGITIRETTDLAGRLRSKRPKTKANEERSGGQARVYLAPLGRSVPRRVADVLLAGATKDRVLCDSVHCCPRGAESMTSTANRRHHAIRSRASALRALDDIPSAPWRLHSIAKEAGAAYITATKANQLLASHGLKEQIKTQGYEALQAAADELRVRMDQRHRDSA